MTICKFCGFDDVLDSLIGEGAPCGIDGCSILTCCYEAWVVHKRFCHKEA